MVAVYRIVIETDNNPDTDRYPLATTSTEKSTSSQSEDWFLAARRAGDIFLPLTNWKSSLGNKPSTSSAIDVKSTDADTNSKSQQISVQQTPRRKSVSVATNSDPRPVDPATHIARIRKGTISGPNPGSKEYYLTHTSPDFRFGRIQICGLDANVPTEEEEQQDKVKMTSSTMATIDEVDPYELKYGSERAKVASTSLDDQQISTMPSSVSPLVSPSSWSSVAGSGAAKTAATTVAASTSASATSTTPVITAINVATTENTSTSTPTVAALKSTFMGYGVVRLYRDVDEGDEQSVQTDDGTVIAILAVPGYMNTSDLLEYLDKNARENSSHIRMISSNGTPSRYMVLIKFREVKYATQFYLSYNGKLFNSMEAETCHVVYIKSVQFRSHIHRLDHSDIPYLLQDPFTAAAVAAATATSSSSTTTPSTVTAEDAIHELPTCPVCLERMDSSTTGLLTILCQHTFHCQCLSKWGDSSCPVCRHTTNQIAFPDGVIAGAEGSSSSYLDVNSFERTGLSSKCYVCEAGSNLWACLICGHVGCGRYDQAHAYDHYVATGHCFSMDISTQRVWDYASDGYVHRLIQNQSDGKLVELPGPSDIKKNKCDKGEKGNNGDFDSDDLGLQYTYLLTSQLESQRDYYEGLCASAVDSASQATARAENAERELQILRSQFEQQIRLQQALEQANSKNEKLKQLYLKLEKEFREEKAMSEKMISKLDQVRKEKEEQDDVVKDLSEQIRDLMLFLDARDKLANAEEDVQQGTVSIGASSKKKKNRAK